MSAGGSPHSPPYPPAASSANYIPRQLFVASYTAMAPLTLFPHSLVRSKHPLKLSGCRNICNSIAQPHPRSQTTLRPSFGLICGSNPGSPFTPRDRARAPLPLQTRLCPQRRRTHWSSFNLVCGGSLCSRPPSPRSLVRNDIPCSRPHRFSTEAMTTAAILWPRLKGATPAHSPQWSSPHR